MVEIKSYSVGNGDMFYIKHKDAFTLIDCNLLKDNEERITNEVNEYIKNDTNLRICRFIITHTDKDHITGLSKLINLFNKNNVYYVDIYQYETENLTESIKDDKNAFEKNTQYFCKIRGGLQRAYLNMKNSMQPNLNCSNINFLWPNTNNDKFRKAARDAVSNKNKINDTCPIIEYSDPNGFNVYWFGDLSNEFMESIKENIKFEKKPSILFAPHHGRESGKLPKEWLNQLGRFIIVLGEAPSKSLCYYSDYNHLCQNTLGDLLFEFDESSVNIFCTKASDYLSNFLSKKNNIIEKNGFIYMGSFNKT